MTGWGLWTIRPLTASGLAFFASFTGDGKGALSLSAGFDDAGTFTDITITASDGDLSDGETLTITVRDSYARGHAGRHHPAIFTCLSMELSKVLDSLGG